jgi:uncharacterized membrane protein (DUF106 family)
LQRSNSLKDNLAEEKIMSKRTRWLLVITLGVMVHLFIAIYTVARLSPYYNLPSYTVGLPPFGQVNYHTADSITVIEWIAVLVLWLTFSISLLREKNE